MRYISQLLPDIRVHGNDPSSALLSVVFSKYGILFFFQAEDGIRDRTVTGVQTCALPISRSAAWRKTNRARWTNCCSKTTTLPARKASRRRRRSSSWPGVRSSTKRSCTSGDSPDDMYNRSEEHTSELQSAYDLVCRLLLEK